jgi:hypothetical protein
LKKSITKKRACGVAWSVGSEFKPQHNKKNVPYWYIFGSYILLIHFPIDTFWIHICVYLHITHIAYILSALYKYF